MYSQQSRLFITWLYMPESGYQTFDACFFCVHQKSFFVSLKLCAVKMGKRSFSMKEKAFQAGLHCGKRK